MLVLSFVLALLLVTASFTLELTDEIAITKIGALHQKLSNAVSLDKESRNAIRDLIHYHDPKSSFLSLSYKHSSLSLIRQYDSRLIKNLLTSEKFHEAQFGAILMVVYPSTSSDLVINLIEAAQFHEFTPNYQLIISRMKSSSLRKSVSIKICDRFLSQDDSVMESNFSRGTSIRTCWDSSIQALSDSSVRQLSISLSRKLSPFWWTELFEPLIRNLMINYENQIAPDDVSVSALLKARRRLLKTFTGALHSTCDNKEYSNEAAIRCLMIFKTTKDSVFPRLMESQANDAYFIHIGALFGTNILELMKDPPLKNRRGRRLVNLTKRKSFLPRFLRHIPNDLWLFKRLTLHTLAAQDPQLFRDCWSRWEQLFLQPGSAITANSFSLPYKVWMNIAESHQFLMKKPSVRYHKFFSAFETAKAQIAADFVDIAHLLSKLLISSSSRYRIRSCYREQRSLDASAASHLLEISHDSDHFHHNLLDVVLGALPATNERDLAEICFGILTHPLLENSQFTIDQLSAAAARIHPEADLIKIFSVASNLPEFAAQFTLQISERFSWGFCKRMPHSSRLSLLPQFPQYTIFLDPVRHFLRPGQEPSIPEPDLNNRDLFDSLLSYSEIDQDLILSWMTCLITSPHWASTTDQFRILHDVVGSSQIDSETYRELLCRILRHSKFAAYLESHETWWNSGGSFLQTWFRELSAQDRIPILDEFPQYGLVLDPMLIFHQPGYYFIEEHIQYAWFYNWLMTVLPSLNPDQLVATAIRMIQTPFWDNSYEYVDLFQSITTQLEAASGSCDLAGLLIAILQKEDVVSQDKGGRIVCPLRPSVHRLFDQLSGEQQKSVCDTCPNYAYDLLARVRPFKITQDNLKRLRNFLTDECAICCNQMLDGNGEPVPVEGIDNVKLEICSLHFCDHFLHLDCLKEFKSHRDVNRCPVCRTNIRELHGSLY